MAARRTDVAIAVAGALVGAGAALVLGQLVAGRFPPGDYDLPIYAVAGAVACAAGRAGGRGGLTALAAMVGAAVYGGLTGDAEGAFVLIAIGGGVAGHVLHDREQVAASLAARARELEEEREAHAALSVRYERARIASELHDIVAHAISVMVVQAGAGQRLAARDPQATSEAFAAIAGAARQAEEDMGRLVALLGDPEAIGPAPDLALVEELVARAAGSGLDVSLRLEGSREGLPAELVAVAYRVVQEGLTNALRYASGSAVSVLVGGAAGELLVEVANGPGQGHADLAGSGSGRGLGGLRERVTACGGTLDAGPVDGGGWRVRARLPRRVRDCA
jgi:signal transduction histidine kinase